MATSLYELFRESSDQFPDRCALEVGDRTYSYRELEGLAEGIADEIAPNVDPAGPAVTAIFAYRSLAAYAGVLGALAAGHAYMPLHPSFPSERTRRMLVSSHASSVVLDERCMQAAGRVLPGISHPLRVVLLPGTPLPGWIAECPQHDFVFPFAKPTARKRVQPAPRSMAYLLFTSGSTGAPKAVMVPHSSVLRYVRTIQDVLAPTPEDRFSQAFDMTFDPSVHDIFVTLASGACLCVVPEESILAPGKFIRDRRLSFWFSVPSTAAFMRKLGMLKPGAFPSLRVSLFAGEALPIETALAWQTAAPSSVVENLYGPTEATIAITRHRVTAGVTTANGIVPIGHPFPEQEAAVVDDVGRPVPELAKGELYLAGTQLALGYLDDEAQTRERWVTLPNVDGGKRVWYRTGDVVQRDPELGLLYAGRTDQQVKILGHRVELGEIEHVLRRAAETELVAVLPWPVTASAVRGVVAFVSQSAHTEQRILELCRSELPPYMVPTTVRHLERMPLTTNGKVDRHALQTLSEAADV